MSDENNYAIWSFLKKCWQRGLLYKGRDVVPWCPRCGTAISQHEILTEEYQEITHKAIFVKLPIFNKKNTYFLVWTTTPWTLPGNVALAVHPDLTYIEIQDDKGDNYILLKDKSNLVPQGRIIKEFPGKELEGLEYRGMFDELEAAKGVEHKVILWKDITQEEGTGIVHIAPGCGAEDYKLAKEFNLPVIDLSDDESNYKKGFGELSEKFVGSQEVKDLIFKNLEAKKRVFKIEDYSHRYPTCWRCKTELIFRLVDEWYISMDKLRKPLMEVAKKIKWIPSFGLERELDWLKNMQDWLISKKRYWGLALPIYECECGNFEVIGSKEELKEKAVKGWDKFNDNSPHRPWIDEIKIKCPRCGKLVSRIPDVGNPWLDAGIVPFSTMTKEWFPADLVCESFPGQFKNWFYALIVMSTVLENTNPIKTIFGYASVRDEKGEEMHKSKGNTIWFDEAVEKVGADPMRWMYVRQNPVYNLNFGYKVADETKRKLLTLWNSFTFFITYVDKKDYPLEEPEPKSKNILDIWIVSRLNGLIEKVSKNLAQYNPSVAVLAIENFFIDDLSLWYIRRSRKRFHSAAKPEERKEAINCLYYILLNLIKLIAPLMPFLAENIYQELKSENMPESIHLSDWPKTDKKLINIELEKKMAKVREITAKALALRAGAGIKVRQPIAELRIPAFANLPAGRQEATAGEEELLDLIKEEVNVKKITFGKEFKLDTKITKELKEEGMVREVIRHIQEMRKKAGLKPKDKILIESTFEPVDLKSFKKEVGAKEFYLKKEVTAGKEIKIDKKTYYFKIKKL